MSEHCKSLSYSGQRVRVAFLWVSVPQLLREGAVASSGRRLGSEEGSQTMPREEIRSNRSASQAGSEFFNTLEEMRRDWMTRATAEVELSLKLSKKLTDAHSVPDAVAAYQEWLNEEMGARAEDARLLMSSGQKFVDASSRFLSSGWTSASTTT